MCGFVGYLDNQLIKDKKEIIKKMNDKIIHRGPDGEGYYVDRNIAMGFRRLGLHNTKSNNQVIFNNDKSLVVNFDGEIYNYQELKEELEKKGYSFKTKYSSEVIVHGYQEYGTKIVKKLRGMFAFVIWDKNAKELFGARDHFGIKPFYYYSRKELFIYGSEIKSFLEHPDFKKELNKDSLNLYLTFQYSPLKETFFKDVFKLLPGHYFKYKNGKLKITQYFDVSYDNGNNSLDETIRKINDVLEESIEYHKRSDVEIGSFLSSGVDSSYIVSASNVKKAYTVGFPNDGFDETKDARDLCEILGIESKSELITADMFFDVLKKVQYHSDEPHANLSAVPLYFLSRLASKDVKVVLSGEGADELFGGYDEYRESKIYSVYKYVPFTLRKGIARLVSKFPHFKGKHFLEVAGETLENKYIGQAFIMDNEEAKEILQEKYKGKFKFQDVTKPYYEKSKKHNELLRKMYLDMNLWLPHDILLKADKMTMAHSLQVRVPFLDQEVYSVSRTLPLKYFIKDNITKYAFRKVAFNKIPEEWAKRKKLGFMVPFKEWILEDKYYQKVKLLFEEEWVSEFFDQEKIIKLLDEHYERKANNGRKVYTIYSFLIWYQVYFLNYKY